MYENTCANVALYNVYSVLVPGISPEISSSDGPVYTPGNAGTCAGTCVWVRISYSTSDLHHFPSIMTTEIWKKIYIM